jgi:hypothetical protein
MCLTRPFTDDPWHMATTFWDRWRVIAVVGSIVVTACSVTACEAPSDQGCASGKHTVGGRTVVKALSSAWPEPRRKTVAVRRSWIQSDHGMGSAVEQHCVRRIPREDVWD